MRFRVAVSLATLVLLVILLQSMAMVLFMHEKEEEFIERQLEQQLAHSMALYAHSPDAALPNAPDMWLYRIGRDGDASEVPPAMASLAPGQHEVFIGSKEYHVAVRDAEAVRFILAYDVNEHESRLDSLMLLTILTAVLLALLTLVAGYLLAGRLTRRLSRLAERVEQGVPGALAEPGMERELRAVADVLDSYRARQGAMLERERAFAANLSHELRTPLTGIRTDAELLAALPDVPEAVHRRGRRIVAGIDRINALAGSLLLLAREARPGPLEELRLRPLIEQVWASLMLAAAKDVALRLDIAPGSTLQADPALAELVIRNLLDNALRYSESGEVLCRLAGARLSVIDSGPGFAEGDLEKVFDRYFVGERGMHGVGLALVRHVCGASGWQVSARNAPGGGAEITLDFGAALTAY